MDISYYQTESRKTAIYPRLGGNLTYPALGLASEAGEIAGKVKKMERDDAGLLTEERRQAIAMELSDVLWYAAAIATELSLDLSQIAEANLTKLKSRQERGVLGGSGDSR